MASLLAALVFMGALAVVFVPRYLEHLNQPPSAAPSLEPNTTLGPRVTVTSVAVALNLSAFNATLFQNTTAVATLPAGLGGGGTVLAFADANGNGLLDAGDYFTVDGSSLPNAATQRYTLQVWQAGVGWVGFAQWTGLLRAA